MCLTLKITFDIKRGNHTTQRTYNLIKPTHSHSVKSPTLYHLIQDSKLAVHDFAHTFSGYLGGKKLKSRVQPCSQKGGKKPCPNKPYSAAVNNMCRIFCLGSSGYTMLLADERGML